MQEWGKQGKEFVLKILRGSRDGVARGNLSEVSVELTLSTSQSLVMPSAV